VLAALVALFAHSALIGVQLDEVGARRDQADPTAVLEDQRVLVELGFLRMQWHEDAECVEDRRQRHPVRESDVDQQRAHEREEAPTVPLARDAGHKVVDQLKD
jgi:hypothetical protein